VKTASPDVKQFCQNPLAYLAVPGWLPNDHDEVSASEPQTGPLGKTSPFPDYLWQRWLPEVHDAIGERGVLIQ
jgi:hypothetical protein